MVQFIADSLEAIRMSRGKTIGDTRRTRVNRNVEGEAAAGAAARPRCSQTTLRGTYLFADHGVDTTGTTFAGAGYEVFDGNGNIEGVFSANSNGEITRNETLSGTYSVKADCTSTVTYADGTRYDQFIAPDGSMLTYVQTKPSEFVTSGFELRGSAKRVGE